MFTQAQNSRARAVRCARPDTVMLAKALGQLGHVGGNLAQLLKKANSGNSLSRGELERTLADIHAMAQDVQAALRN